MGAGGAEGGPGTSGLRQGPALGAPARGHSTGGQAGQGPQEGQGAHQPGPPTQGPAPSPAVPPPVPTAHPTQLRCRVTSCPSGPALQGPRALPAGASPSTSASQPSGGCAPLRVAPWAPAPLVWLSRSPSAPSLVLLTPGRQGDLTLQRGREDTSHQLVFFWTMGTGDPTPYSPVFRGRGASALRCHCPRDRDAGHGARVWRAASPRTLQDPGLVSGGQQLAGATVLS